MSKGYPKTQFEIVDQSQILEVPQDTVDGSSIPLAMAAYTSDKGPENWKIFLDLENFIKQTGPINFNRHGQSQLTVAEILRAGGAVFCKRMVSEDAYLANTTVRAKVIVSEGVSYLYFYTTSIAEAVDFEAVTSEAYGDGLQLNTDASTNDVSVYDAPLFTVAAMGRGASNIKISVSPSYNKSVKSSRILNYVFKVTENNEDLEKIYFTMNPNIITEGVSQALNPKVKASSRQVKINMYDDCIFDLVTLLARTTTLDGVAVSADDLINNDFVYGSDRSGRKAYGGLVTSAGEKVVSDNNTETDLWVSLKPVLEDGSKYCDTTLSPSNNGKDVPVLFETNLYNGTYGTMGEAPLTNTSEYTKMLKYTFGYCDIDEVTGEPDLTNRSMLFDPIIYDLDAYKIDFIADCNYPLEVKEVITNLVDFRGDMVYLADLCMTADLKSEDNTYIDDWYEDNDGAALNNYKIIKAQANKLVDSMFVAIYHNYFKIYDPYTRRQITVTMPFLLAPLMVKHLAGGASRPFAGIPNNIVFPEIIDGSVNFIPVTIPGLDEKQMLVDSNINYLSLYDGNYVMETMYTNYAEYSQMSYLHNILAIQEVIKTLRTRCPRVRYSFLDGSDLQYYIDDATAVINQFSSNFASIEMEYLADENYERNNIFYAAIKVRFKNFIQEEHFKVFCIS